MNYNLLQNCNITTEKFTNKQKINKTMKREEFNKIMKQSFGDKVVNIPNEDETMVVTIQQRSVYHKFAEIEINIPNYISEDEIVDYIHDNEDQWVDKIDHKINESEFVFGTGLYDIEGMEDAESDSEWRYDCKDLKTGGHL